jgi:putative flippase GtrA
MSARTKQSVGWFVLVGCAAAAVHLATVVVLVDQVGLVPLVANVGGWLLAFGVSFAGHLRLSFAHQDAPLQRAAARFFLVSLAGFVVNEAAYAMLLGWTGLGFRAALVAVLLGVALLTYWLGRHWAFLGSPAR